MALVSSQLLMLILLMACLAVAKEAPTALEINYKNRITALLNTSAQLAADHLSRRLALGPQGVFGGYELEIGESAKKQKWLHECSGVDASRDSVENCALRQLQALTALCDVEGLLTRDKAAKQLVQQHLSLLTKQKKVPSLGLSLKRQDSAGVWLYEQAASQVDASPPIQASVLMAVARCGAALELKDHLDEAESWFLGLNRLFPQTQWNNSVMTYHRSSICWESLALTTSHVGKQSDFYDELQAFISSFEAFLLQIWEEDMTLWSFASARALLLRWQLKGLKKKQKTMMKRWAQEHVDRFLGHSSKSKPSGLDGSPQKTMSEGILAKIGGARYTCAPLQGLMSLAAILNDPELIQVTLQLIEKDIQRYQLSSSNSGPFGEAAVDPTLVGAFFRDEDQMKMEKRQTLRVDDTAMCLIAMTQALKTLESIQGVSVQGEAAQAASRAPEL